jgi:putative endonuclease
MHLMEFVSLIMSEYFIYIVTNKQNHVFYIGITKDAKGSFSEHKEKLNRGFISNRNSNNLLWFEKFDSISEANAKEKQLRDWLSDFGGQLIERENPDWNNLFEGWYHPAELELVRDLNRSKINSDNPISLQA